MTLTRIKYNLQGLDEVIHNYKMDDEYTIQANFIGKDEYIKNSQDKTYLKALLGTDNAQEINRVFQKISQKHGYISRLNSKPQSVDERVVWFIANDDWICLNFYRGPNKLGPSLGVFACAEGGKK